MYCIKILSEAEKDLKAAFNWYELQRKGLGYDFLMNIEAGLNFLIKNPFACNEIYRCVRRYIIKRFPYNIFYLIEDKKIIILAFLYNGRNPDIIRKCVNFD